MAELQLSVVSDPASKRQMETQIAQWEDNLERLHCEQFRLRCYMASLQNGELPNPKVSEEELAKISTSLLRAHVLYVADVVFSPLLRHQNLFCFSLPRNDSHELATQQLPSLSLFQADGRERKL